MSQAAVNKKNKKKNGNTSLRSPKYHTKVKSVLPQIQINILRTEQRGVAVRISA
jgi:hypothetical protein